MDASNVEPAILLEGVSKRYGDKVALRDLSLSIPPGELFAFLGPNGAGKTTTIKLITGLLKPSAGRVRVCGNDMAGDRADARRPISLVPDQPYLYDKLTGRDFLRFLRDIHGLAGPEVAEREADLIRRFEMTEFVDDLIETYSHGMRQRTAFAAALMHEPKVLVVDEPMVGLDPRSMRIVKDLLKEVTGRGTAVFMSTHTLPIAEEIADRIGIIHRGKLIHQGTIEELRAVRGGNSTLEEFFLEVTRETAA